MTKFSEVKNLAKVNLDKHYGGIFSLQYNYDGSRVCAGFSGGGIRVRTSHTTLPPFARLEPKDCTCHLICLMSC